MIVPPSISLMEIEWIRKTIWEHELKRNLVLACRDASPIIDRKNGEIILEKAVFIFVMNRMRSCGLSIARSMCFFPSTFFWSFDFEKNGLGWEVSMKIDIDSASHKLAGIVETFVSLNEEWAIGFG